jgi:hypothetical protein
MPAMTMEQTVTVTITTNAVSTNHPPSLIPVGDRVMTLGQTLVIPISANDPDTGQTLSFSLSGDALPGAEIASSNGVFTWRPQQAGTYSCIIQVVDNGVPVMSDSHGFTIIVRSDDGDGSASSNSTLANGTGQGCGVGGIISITSLAVVGLTLLRRRRNTGK